MNVSVPRYLIVALAAVFSAYHLLLAAVSLGVPRQIGPALAAMMIYGFATVISLRMTRTPVMPLWVATFNVVTAIVVPVLVTSQLHRPFAQGYSAWHTAAIGTLMVITSTRHRHAWAWCGTLALVVQTVAWAGLGGLVTYGVIGSVGWVAVSHALSSSLARAARDTRQYAAAEREAVEWRAAQEAHVSERQFRLGQTSRMSLPMLRQVVIAAGDLSAAQRQECLYVEGAIRDEIRGRTLLNDLVREEVMRARRAGVDVIMLDEGGIDDLNEAERAMVLGQLAEAIRDTQTGRLIVRTVPEGSGVAITVVALSSQDDGSARALGRNSQDDDDEQVDLWLEIRRPGAAPPAMV